MICLILYLSTSEQLLRYSYVHLVNAFVLNLQYL